MAGIYSSYEALAKDLEKIRQGKKLVFTNGCFDIIHPGHIHVLNQAKRLGDILIVGLNSNDSVSKLKGCSRPVFDEQARSEILISLNMVDYVVVFKEETPYELIKTIRPDILVKGAQYGEGEVVGEDIVKETVRIDMKPGYSSSGIIEKIKNEHPG